MSIGSHEVTDDSKEKVINMETLINNGPTIKINQRVKKKNFFWNLLIAIEKIEICYFENLLLLSVIDQNLEMLNQIKREITLVGLFCSKKSPNTKNVFSFFHQFCR